MAKKQKHPSPNPNDKAFTETWNLLVDEVASRPEFKTGNLLQLRILCDLYCENDRLLATLRREGSTIETDGGRNGPQTKPRPELSQLNVIRTEIRNYSRLLGFVLSKEGTSNGQEDKDDWK